MHVDIFCDGACKGNPGPGGWGAILRCNGAEKQLVGGEPHTTNNRMELLGVINSLKILKVPCTITLTTDSKYVVDAINKGWHINWERNNWIKADGKPVANQDLWEELMGLLHKHNVSFMWVHGHQGNPDNERCDKLASEYAMTMKG